MSPGRKSLMSIGGGLSLLCCDSCKWEVDFKVVLSPCFDRKIYFDTLVLFLWLSLPLNQGECVLFCLKQLRSPAQNRFQAENHTWKVALLGIFLNGISWPSHSFSYSLTSCLSFLSAFSALVSLRRRKKMLPIDNTNTQDKANNTGPLIVRHYLYY